MKRKSVVIFDFDGVLTVGGEGLKQEAWDMLVRPWGLAHKQIFQGQREKYSGGKGSRYDILRESFRLMSCAKYELIAAAYADGYNTIVNKLLEQSGMPEGTEAALVTLRTQSRELFVNSATPEVAVQESVKKFDIAHHFCGIFGQPLTKEQNLARAQHIARVDHGAMLFVGDSEGDWKAAREFQCDFIGVANEWNKWTADTVKFPLIKSVAELPALLA